MPRLRDVVSGVVVSVSDSTAARLGVEWVDVDEAERLVPQKPSKKKN